MWRVVFEKGVIAIRIMKLDIWRMGRVFNGKEGWSFEEKVTLSSIPLMVIECSLKLRVEWLPGNDNMFQLLKDKIQTVRYTLIV